MCAFARMHGLTPLHVCTDPFAEIQRYCRLPAAASAASPAAA
jgi:hypothetical protein